MKPDYKSAQSSQIESVHPSCLLVFLSVNRAKSWEK